MFAYFFFLQKMVVFVFPLTLPCLATKLSPFALQTMVHEGTSPGQGMGTASGPVENIHSKGQQAAAAAAADAAAATAAAVELQSWSWPLRWRPWALARLARVASLAGVASVSREEWLHGAWPTHPETTRLLDIYLCSRILSLAHGSHHARWVGVAKGEAGRGMDGCWCGQDVS